MPAISDISDSNKFPGHAPTGLPPSPTAENPGGVYPHSDPDKASPPPPMTHNNSSTYFGNPFLMNEAFSKLDHALSDVIHILEDEEPANSEQSDNRMLNLFSDWRDQLDSIRTGKKSSSSRSISRTPARRSPENEGGLFVD
ncbi:hypothetical protein CYLTODRAFT_422347, partial [Cylindrobasidium torrendii FP15055 ss-10]